MLQQTTVAVVAPRYEAFLRRFPTLEALAHSQEDEVLKHWAGLGYYARARNLRRAARVIVADHGGKFPAEFDAVLGLPGIGRYTAGAILSIAFQKPYPLVDGNIIRVFSRLFGIRGRAKDPRFIRKIWALAERLLPQDKPGHWNQALMELGATVCAPMVPACSTCPISGHCVAFRKNIQDKLPLSEARRKPVPVRWTCLWIEKNGKVLLWRRSDDERLLKNLWGLPEAGRLAATPGRLLSRATHSITHHALNVELRQASLDQCALPPSETKWVPRNEINDYLISSLWLKLIRAL